MESWVSDGYLLDTNALIGFCYDPDSFGPKTTQKMLLVSGLSYSPVSITELVIKKMLGKLNIDPNAVVSTMGLALITELDYDSSSALEILDFGRLSKHDPFDRMLISICAKNKLKLITSDKLLLKIVPSLTVDSSL
jgi:PIN domain nuclease of toxin-antitoxin system